MSDRKGLQTRLTFECWSCQRTYEMMHQIEDGQVRLIVACPYCEAEGVADLLPYRRDESVTLNRSLDSGGAVGGNTNLHEFYDLPDILPTAEVLISRRIRTYKMSRLRVDCWTQPFLITMVSVVTHTGRAASPPTQRTIIQQSLNNHSSE